MSASSRDELLVAVRPQYLEASLGDKKLLLDSFVDATGYCRKYAIALLSKGLTGNERRRERKKKYDQQVHAALIRIWKAANQICSKRLIPFLPTLIRKLEVTGHLDLSEETRMKLLSLSPATADRLLKAQRRKYGKGKSTTKAGSLLKEHIAIRTFADWSDVKPGFLESDLVAHCGGNIRGQFLYTLTMTDIATGWTELTPLPSKSSEDTLRGMRQTKSVLPFAMLGFDSDNGSEFINNDVVKWCEANGITFTRSREYRKNDQAHVEEKNGSIVRRFVGYNRYEGYVSLKILACLYWHIRLYTNFFQPSLKLVSKERDGSRVHKKYDKALTPYQRVLNSKFIPREQKAQLRMQFERLDPLLLLEEIQELQEQLSATAVKSNLSELRSLAIAASKDTAA